VRAKYSKLSKLVFLRVTSFLPIEIGVSTEKIKNRINRWSKHKHGFAATVSSSGMF
jgi:hypothetical protein